jgi:hypothetical protein
MVDTNGSSAPAAAGPANGGSVRIPGHIVREAAPEQGAEDVGTVLDALHPLGCGTGARDAAARAAAPARVIPAVPFDPFALPAEDVA